MDDRTTFEQFMEQWIEGRKLNLRAGSWKRYEQMNRQHVSPNIGRIPLTKLQPQHLERLYTNRISASLSPTTVLQMHRMIHKALKQAVAWGLVYRNVAAFVQPPKPTNKTVRPFSPDEAQTFIKALKDDDFEALYLMALMTGMRLGELLAIQWDDIDLDRGIAVVRHTLSQAWNSHGYEIGPTKTLKSTRSVLLARPVVAALVEHRKRQEKMKEASWGSWAPLNLVFTNAVGWPLNPSNLRTRSFYPLLTKAGLRKIRFHDLRHTSASLLLGEGIHPKIVSEMLGHSQISITLDLYSHVSQTMLEQARNAFDDLFGCQIGCNPPLEGSDDGSN